MKILIYGFKPYGRWRENITERVVGKVRGRKGLKKAVFPVRFERGIFLKEIKKCKPDIILGLGQCPRGKKLRIERRAANLKRSSKKEKPKIISKGRPKYQFVNLRLEKSKISWVSYNAGKYVCNFSMYIISDFSKDKNIKFAFIHIPKDYDVNKAVEFIETEIDGIIEREE